MPIFNNILAGASGQATGYDIEQSLRFEDGDTPYLSRTPSAGNRKTWTWSGWIKHSTVGSDYWENVFGAKTDSNNYAYIVFEADVLRFFNYVSSSANGSTSTSEPKYRDPAAWRHVVIAWDTTQSTDTNRLKIYINGEQLTLPATVSYPTLNHDGIINSATPHYIGGQINGEFDGYLAEMHFIDGQALTPASFGESNEDTNQWQAIKYSGSYSGNSFYLKFASGAIGTDSSGLGNTFTATNLSSTTSVSLDSPTNNFATLNPLNLVTNTTLSEGNLKADCTSSNDGAALGTMAVSSGKWYWEVLQTTANATDDISCGLMELSRKMSPQTITDVYNNSYLYGNDGWNAKHSSTTSTINSYGAGDIIGWALDLDGNTLKIYKNNSLEYTYSSGVSGTFTPLAAVDGTSGSAVTHIANFGQDSSFNGEKTAQGNGGDGEDFYYSPPTGYKALNTDNLDDPSIADPTAHFDTALYTGNGSTQTISSLNFQPDFVWIKNRTDSSTSHGLFNSVMGAGVSLKSNDTASERPVSGSPGATDDMYAFTSSGFSVGTDNYINVNTSTKNYVSWNWKGGGAASSNSDGTITSSVSANTDAGFSIVSWTGTGSNATVGHGLSQAPELVINKSRSQGNVYAGWTVYSKPTWVSTSNTNLLYLNTTAAEADDTNIWQDAPTATVIQPQGGAWEGIGVSGENYIALCFHSVPGFSSIGKYTGTGSTSGPFIYTGFSVGFLMVKLATAADGYWVMFDNKRDPDNPTGKVLYANINAADTDVSSYAPYDLLSNGFKSRIPGGNGNEASYNSSGQTYIYLSFAESPFKTSNAR